MFGMIEGAIIGGAVGLVVSLIMLLKRKGLRDRFLKLLRKQGPDAARALLDDKHPALTKISLNGLLNQRERMAALTLLNHRDAIEDELANHRGALSTTVQVGAIGLLGLTLRGPKPEDPAQRLDQLATKMEQEGGRTFVLVKKKTRALATLARAVARGEKIPSDVRMSLDSFTSDKGLVPLLIWQALAVALDSTGQQQQAAGLRAKVQALTNAFDG